MAHLAKYTRGATCNLTRHFERAKKENGEYISFKNQDIDLNRTHLNYNLAPEQNQLEYIKRRCSEIQCMNRDDVKVMCAWVVTMPKGLRGDEEKQFFEATYDFLRDRYGEKNIISSYVHLDEVTPHTHFAFIPVVIDKKKGVEKVSAKECVNKRDLQTFHTDLERHMKEVFGRDIGVLNEATKEGNKSVEDLKRGTARKEITKLTEEKKTLTEEKKALEGSIREQQVFYRDKKKKLDDMYEKYKSELETKIEVLKKQYKGMELVSRQISEIQPEKTLMGTIKGVTLEEIQNLKNMAMLYPEAKEELGRYKEAYGKLKEAYDDIKGRVPSMMEQIKQMRANGRLEELEEAFQRLPVEVRNQLLPTKAKAQSVDRGR